MSLKIIGAGYGRTGTKSMKTALELLGYGPCYHMSEVFENLNHVPIWHKAAFDEEVEWDEIFSEYHSGVDWPMCHFWEPLSIRYPNAKILLTVRPANEWYASMKKTIFSRASEKMGNDGPMRLWKEMVDKIVRLDTFSNKTDDGIHCEEIFEQHISNVSRKVEKSRLIIYHLGSGWEPLCSALGEDIPDIPFPMTNTSSEFQENIRNKTKP